MAMKTYVAGDSANLMLQARLLNRRSDWHALRRFLGETGMYEPFEFELFVRMPPTTEPFREKYVNQKRFVNWALDNRFLVTEVEGTPGGEGLSEFKADADCQIAVSTLEVVERARPDAVVLVTADGDFAPLAHALRRRGIHVAVASRLRMTSEKLNHAANVVIDLEEEMRGWSPLDEPVLSCAPVR